MDVIANSKTQKDVSIDDIKHKLPKYTETQIRFFCNFKFIFKIRDAIYFLTGEGHIYTGSTDDHFSFNG